MQDKVGEVLLCIRPSNRGWCVFSQAPLSSPLTHCPPTMLVMYGTCRWQRAPGSRWNGSFSILHYLRFPPILSSYSPASPAAEPAGTPVCISITAETLAFLYHLSTWSCSCSQDPELVAVVRISIPLPKPSRPWYYSSSFSQRDPEAEAGSCRTHLHSPSATNVALVSIVVTGLASPALAEVRVEIKCN